MVKLLSVKLKDYILIITALCGQCERSDLKEIIGDEKAVDTAVRNLKEEGLLREKRSNGYKPLRLTKKGRDIIYKIPPLNYFFSLVFPGVNRNDDLLMKRKNAYTKVMLEAVRCGFPIGNLKATYTKTLGKGYSDAGDIPKEPEMYKAYKTPLSNTRIYYEEPACFSRENALFMMLKSAAKEKAFFLPAPAIKQAEQNESVQVVSSKAKGVFMGEDMCLSAYYFGSDENFSRNSEVKFSEKVRLLHLNAYPDSKVFKILPKGSCVILTETEEEAVNIISKDRLKNAGFTQSFSAVHVFRRDDAKLRMILSPGFYGKLLSSCYKEDEIKSAKEIKGLRSDAVVEGRYSFEFISQDMVKIERAKKYLRSGGSIHIVCEESQIMILKKIFDGYEERLLLEEINHIC